MSSLFRPVSRFALACAAIAAVPACNLVLGLDSFIDCPEDPKCAAIGAGGSGGATSTTSATMSTTSSDTTSTSSSSSTSSTTSSATGGTGGAPPAPTCTDGVKNGDETAIDCGGTCLPCTCTPGDVAPCYTGPSGTGSVGLCKPGQATCDPQGKFGQCQGDTLPGTESCANTADEDCDGQDCVQWAKLFGDATNQVVRGLVVDAAGNVTIAGEYTGTVAFDPAKPLSTNGTDLYLAKFDSHGAPLWSKTFHPMFGGVGGHAVDLLTNAQGELFLIANQSSDIDFGGGQFGGGSGSTIVKFGGDGSFMWNVSYRFEPNDDFGTTFAGALDAAGNIVMTGTSYCGQSCLPDTTLVTWFAKFAPNGSLTWQKGLKSGGPTEDRVPNAITTDPFGNIILAGSFRGAEVFGPFTQTVNSAGGHDVFVAKYDSAGKLVWASAYGDSAEQSASGVVTDSLGNIYLLGSFAGILNFGAAGNQMTSAGKSDIFVAKLSSAKAFVWSKPFGNAADQSGTGIAVDKNGTILFTGAVEGPVDFGGGTLSGGGGLDLPLVKLDKDGAYLWGRVFGDNTNQVGQRVRLADSGLGYLVADVPGPVNLGGGAITSGGGIDILAAQFAP